MKEHFIEATTEDGVWLTGTIDNFPFGIKVTDKKSGFGIYGGRIVKLFVNSIDASEELFAYERGWEQEPETPEEQSLLAALVLFASGLPRQEVWQERFKTPRAFFADEDFVLELEADDPT